MQKEAALVIIKPDGITKGLVGNVFMKLDSTGLEMVAIKIAKPKQEIVEEHYAHIKGEPFFQGVIDYLLGKFHKRKKLLAIIYYGTDAIKKCRKIAGATNPEEAEPETIRGAYGRITTKGIYENVVHVSSDKKEAEREIKLWFEPEDVTAKLYATKIYEHNGRKKRIWA